MLRLISIFLIVFLLNSSDGILFIQRNCARDFHSLDGLWTFVREPSNSRGIGFAEKWYERDLRQFKNATVMPVPSAFNDLTADVRVRDHVGWVWYQTRYSQSALISKDARSFLRFSSVNYHAEVFLNGMLVGTHTGGHLPFEFEVKLRNPGSNTITVAVNNTLSHSTIPPGEFQYKSGKMYPEGFFTQTPGFDFFNYAGILRSVYVVYTGSSYINDITVIAHVDNSSVSYTVDGEFCSSCKVSATVVDPEGTPLALHSGRNGNLNLTDEELQLWWPRGYGNQPLYTLRVTVLKDGEIIDSYDEQFGFRTVSWTSDHILINNRRFYCVGFGMHEDFELHGRGYDPVVMTKDFNMLEWMGGNCYRTSHYPYSEERAREADRRGIVVITETPAVGMKVFNAQNQRLHAYMLQKMIARDKNHPSVIAWSISNEPWTNKKEARQYYKDLVDIAHIVDPTRPVTIVYGPTGYADDVTADLVDIICVNRYYGWYINMGYLQTVNSSLVYDFTQWKEKFKRPLIITEYGADAIAGLLQEPSMDFSEQYQVDLIRQTHLAFDSLRKKNILAGEMIWNFADFMTAQDPLELGRSNGCAMNVVYDHPLSDQPTVGVIAPLTKTAIIGSPLCHYSYEVADGTYRNLAVGPRVSCCAVSHDQAAFAYATNVMTIIDSSTARDKRSNLIHDGAVRGICQYNKNPYCWMSTSDDRSLRSWDTRDYPGDVKFPSKPSRNRAVSMSPDDNVVVVAGDSVMMYDVRTRRLLNEIAMNSPVLEMCVHHREALLAVGCEDGIISFWDMDTLECVSQSSVCDGTIRSLQFIGTPSSSALAASGRSFVLLAATDSRLCTLGYEPFEMCSFVPMAEHNVTLDMRVGLGSDSPYVATLGYLTDRRAWSVQQIDLEVLLSAQPVSSTTSAAASVADESESISPSSVDTDELESPLDEEIKLIPPPAQDDFKVVPVQRNPLVRPKPPRPLSRPSSATGAPNPRMTHASETHASRSRRGDALKSRVVPDGQRPPKPTSLAARARTSSKSSTAAARSSSKGANGRRSSAHPPLQRRSSRSPSSGPVTEVSVLNGILTGGDQVLATLDRRLKQSAALMRTLQSRGIDEAMAEAIETGDSTLLAEMIGHLNKKPKLWKIALIARIAPHLRKVLSERNEAFVDNGIEALRTIVTSFGDLLHTTAKTNPADIGVNVAAEERQIRCIKCIEALRELRINQPFLEPRMSAERRMKFKALMEIYDNKIETLK